MMHSKRHLANPWFQGGVKTCSKHFRTQKSSGSGFSQAELPTSYSRISIRFCLTDSLFTGSFRNWVRKRSPSKCCKLSYYPLAPALCLMGKLAERPVTSGWRALADVPTTLVTHLQKPPINKPPARHSLTPEIQKPS